MATVTLRPTSATASSWSSIANAYDTSTSTSATVSIKRSNYSSRTATFNFNTSSIPSGATINSATLYVNAKASANSIITLYADINGSSSSRVINSALTTTQGDKTADVKSYMSSLSTIKLTGYMTSNTSTTFTLYDVRIEVDYTEPVTQYTVTFKDWDGTTLKTQTVNSGASATAPSDPTRAGYTFTGWDKAFTNVTSDLTVTAQYTQNSSGGGGTVSGDGIVPFTITRATCVDYNLYDEQFDNYFISSSGEYILSDVESTLEMILKSKDSDYFRCDLYDEYESAQYQAFIDLEFDISAYSNISKAELTLTLKCPSANGEHGYLIVTIGTGSNRFTRQPDIQQTSFTDVTYDVTQYLSYASNGKLVVALDLSGYSPYARITSSAASYYIDYVGLKITGDSSGGGTVGGGGDDSGGETTTATKNICIGGSVIQELYIGSQSIIKAYIGDVLLYSKSSGGTDTPVDPPSGGEGGDMLEGLTWNSGVGVVRTGFTPNNQSWIDTIHMPMSGGEWSKALYIDVDIDISKCEVGVLEPIISVGTDITSGSTSCFHVYFKKTADTKGVIHTVAKYGTKTTESDTLSVTINTRKVRIAFDSDYGYETGKVGDSSLSWDTNFNTAISQCCLTHTPIYVGLASGEYSDAITYEISVATYDY